MSRNEALLLVLVYLMVSCLVTVKPACSSDSPAENTWVTKAPMHEARSSLGVAVVNGKIYAIGGSNTNGALTGINEEYDPETDMWTFKTTMLTPRNNFAIATYQNRIYCIGGATSSNVTTVNEVYDPATDTWETRTPLPTARRGLQANVVDGKIYLIGGAVPDSSAGPGFSFVTVNEVYDPVTDSWATKAPKPNATGSVASVTVDDKIYVIGGQMASTLCLNEIYDPMTDSWSSGVSPPAGVGYGIAGATTGLNAIKRIYFVYNSGIQYYDPQNGDWGSGAGMLTSRSDCAIAVLNDQLYVIGGYTTTCNTVSLSPDSPISDWMQWNANGGAVDTDCATVEVYVPFGYGAVPASVQIVSLENNTTYSGLKVALNFTLNKPVSWMGYSLDGEGNVTISGNTTLSDLAVGSHSITLYANDSFGNTGASETVTFNVASPFPTVPVAVASGASITAIAIGLVVYFKKRKSHISVVKKF